MTIHPLNKVSALSLLIIDVCSSKGLIYVIYDVFYDNLLLKTDTTDRHDITEIC